MLLRLNDFSSGYSKNEFILQSVNFELNEGEIYGVLGKNGCGKSTLLKGVLYGTPCIQGNVYFKDEHLTRKNVKRVLSEIGICLPTGFSYGHLTVEENLRFISAYYPKENNYNLNKLIDLFKLNALREIKAENLSTGQRKKLDLAMVFSHNPKLILLDEPTANIDISTKTEILEIIKTINIEQKVSFLICTHFLEEIEILNASYIILKDGNFVFDSKNQPELSITNIKEIYLQNTR